VRRNAVPSADSASPCPWPSSFSTSHFLRAKFPLPAPKYSAFLSLIGSPLPVVLFPVLKIARIPLNFFLHVEKFFFPPNLPYPLFDALMDPFRVFHHSSLPSFPEFGPSLMSPLSCEISAISLVNIFEWLLAFFPSNVSPTPTIPNRSFACSSKDPAPSLSQIREQYFHFPAALSLTLPIESYLS